MAVSPLTFLAVTMATTSFMDRWAMAHIIMGWKDKVKVPLECRFDERWEAPDQAFHKVFCSQVHADSVPPPEEGTIS